MVELKHVLKIKLEPIGLVNRWMCHPNTKDVSNLIY